MDHPIQRVYVIVSFEITVVFVECVMQAHYKRLLKVVCTNNANIRGNYKKYKLLALLMVT